jgi:hypothetical protein
MMMMSMLRQMSCSPNSQTQQNEEKHNEKYTRARRRNHNRTHPAFTFNTKNNNKTKGKQQRAKDFFFRQQNQSNKEKLERVNTSDSMHLLPIMPQTLGPLHHNQGTEAKKLHCPQLNLQVAQNNTPLKTSGRK